MSAALRWGVLRGLIVSAAVLAGPPMLALLYRVGLLLHTLTWVPLGDTPFGY